MKRTPLKRGKRIRPKRKNPRWNQNRNVIELFLEDHPDCQLRSIFTPPGGHSQGVDPHHLLRIKVDVGEALLSVCRACHTWGHEHDREFAALTLLAKHRAGELDVDRLSELKRKRIEWFLQPIDGMRPEALAAIAELKGKGIYW